MVKKPRKTSHELTSRLVAIDTETTGLRPHHGDRAFMFAYCSDHGEIGVGDMDDEGVQWLRDVLTDADMEVIFHNGKFDIQMLAFHGINPRDIKARVHCTLIMSKLYNGVGVLDHSLESLAARYVNRDTADKTEITDWLKANNKPKMVKERGFKFGFQHAPREVVERRALWDVESTLYLYKWLSHHIFTMCPTLYETERRLMFVVVDMQLNGVEVDITHAEKLRAIARRGMGRCMTMLRWVIPDEFDVRRKRKGEEVIETLDRSEFKPTSPQHMVGVFESMGIELKYKTKPKKKKGGIVSGGGNWAFDETSMMKYASPHIAHILRDSGEEGWGFDRFYREVERAIIDNDLDQREWVAPLVLKYRELSKMVSTYYDHIIDDAVDVRVEPSGRKVGVLHCSFNQSEAQTGRFSSSDPNLQNMPRLLGPRECFIPRRGRNHIHLDYSQVEMRLFVHFAEDDVMASAIDGDIHETTAAKVYKVDKPTKEQRKRAKGVNFGIIYGSGAATMAETLTSKGLPTSVSEAKTLVSDYHAAFPSVRRVTDELNAELVREGFVTNPFGRRYHIPPKVGYKALNYMCQGTSADIIKQAMVAVWDYIIDHGMSSRIVMTIHDEIVLEMPPAEQHHIGAIMDIMDDLESFFVPITTDAEIVKTRWSNKVDMEVPRAA